jgi:tRNA-binding protein
VTDQQQDGGRFAPESLPAKPETSPADLQALDLRVGRVVEARPFPEARTPALRLRVDFGPELGERETSAQITNYPVDELVGRQVVGVVNIGSRRIAGFDSRFLVLGGLEPDGTVSLLAPDDDLPPGATVA